MIRPEACKGCRNDFYNHDGHALDGKRCWSAKDGRMVTRYRLHWWTPPLTPGAFTEVRVPSCYHQPGQYAYQERPHSQAIDVVRIKRSTATRRASP